MPAGTSAVRIASQATRNEPIGTPAPIAMQTAAAGQLKPAGGGTRPISIALIRSRCSISLRAGLA